VLSRLERLLTGLSLRGKLALITLGGVSLLAVVGGVALAGLAHSARGGDSVEVLSRALHYHLDGDMMHEALLADVYASLLVVDGEPVLSAGALEREVADHANRLRANLHELTQLELDGPAAAALAETRPLLEVFLAKVEGLAALAAVDARATAAALRDVQATFVAAEEAQARATGLLNDEVTRMSASAGAAEQSARLWIGATVLGALAVGLALTLLLGHSILGPLRSLGGVARQVVDGDLEARATQTGSDEVAQLGQALNEMADSLTALVRQHELDAERDRFRSQLGEAFEQADDEGAVHAVVERAMALATPSTPMELLLADSSRAHLRREAASPTAGAPGCPVESPFGCVAVRRGSAIVFESSEALNACSRLGGRSAPCWAVCVPVTFMGRALGVLHATGPDGNPPEQVQLERLATLASLAGTRIGTVRAFRRTQLQASTDGLTGLVNRRTFESKVRELLTGDEPVAIAVGDLDRFKELNDTFGHEAGDRALRLFASVLRDSVRSDDVAARLGGEEFALALRGLTASDAVGRLERIREVLAEATARTGQLQFTVSFGVTDSTVAASLDELLRVADAGLYAAKQAGRDRIEIGSVLAAHLAASRQPAGRDREAPPEESGERLLSIVALDGDDEPRPTGVEIR
jgi:diguanylate cyclase (GGDEF)-like protein